MNIQERINNTENHQFRIIFHNVVNNHDTLFGGTAMQWMDEVAYITATRFTRMNMITVSVEKVDFLKPVKVGMIAEVVGKVIKSGAAKIVIQVDIFIEDLDSDQRSKAVEALFTFAAINENHNPIRIELVYSLIDQDVERL